MRRTVRFLPLALTLALGSYAHAKEHLNYNANVDEAASASMAGSAYQAGGGAAGVVASVDPVRGVPTFFWAAQPSQIVQNPLSAAHGMSAGPEALARAFAAQSYAGYRF